MILRTEDIIACGAYADIFRPPDRMLAYKLFASGQHPTNVSQDLTCAEDDDRRRKTFLSECGAYERAADHPLLRSHIPRFFRRSIIEDVKHGAGSVAHRYMLAHCYVMEYIEGVARKLGEFPIEHPPDHIEKALQAFREAGIQHLLDSSIFFPDDPENFKFIDFAIEEFQAFW